MHNAFTVGLDTINPACSVYRGWKKKALILQGGPEFHHPREISVILARVLEQENFEVEISDTMDVFLDEEKLKQTDLIIPNWTGGTITNEQLNNFLKAVESGTGIAGIHGGMGDAFRGATDYQAMVGGQFLAHPGRLPDYRVHITDPSNPIVRGIGDFFVTDEQYYMMVDPSVHVLAASYFAQENPPLVWRPVMMPVTWIKKYGQGSVFYTSLGHFINTVLMPEVLTMIRRGMVWAAR